MTIMMILLRIYDVDDYDVGQLGMTFDDDAGDYVVDKKFQWIWLWYIMLNRIFDGGDVMLIMNLKGWLAIAKLKPLSLFISLF